MRAAIYARISRDREGAGINVATQVADCRKHCAERGYDVVAVYTDNDQSAWSGKPREGYDDLLRDMREGRCNVVVVLHTDRLTRSARDLEDIIDSAAGYSVSIESLRGGPVDLTHADGQLQARIAGAVARHESDQKAARIRRKHQQLAESGAPASLAGSFGYDGDGSLNAVQAAVIREMADRVLAGESLRSITSWLNTTGVATAKGGSWSSSTVKQILTSGRICGWREWTPRTPVGSERVGWNKKPRRGHGDGELIAQGTWEAIISLEQHRALRSLLLDPRRRKSTRRHYLLSAGILRCGLCGKGLNHKTETQRSSKRDAEGNRLVLRQVSRYACIKQSGRGCGKMSISCPDADEWITEALFEVLCNVDLRPKQPEARADAADLVRRLADANLRLDQIDDAWATGEVDRAAWRKMRSTAEGVVEELERQMPALDQAGALRGLPTDAPRLREAWPEMELDRRRAVVTAVIDRIIVRPARAPKERPRGFDPERLDVVWRV